MTHEWVVEMQLSYFLSSEKWTNCLDAEDILEIACVLTHYYWNFSYYFDRNVGVISEQNL